MVSGTGSSSAPAAYRIARPAAAWAAATDVPLACGSVSEHAPLPGQWPTTVHDWPSAVPLTQALSVAVHTPPPAQFALVVQSAPSALPPTHTLLMRSMSTFRPGASR